MKVCSDFVKMPFTVVPGRQEMLRINQKNA